MHVGLLTGGGDAPGLNGILESACRRLLRAGHRVTGIRDGFEGVYLHNVTPLREKDIAGIHGLPGTILGTSSRVGIAGREQEFLERYRMLGLDALLVAGGDGTFLALGPLAHHIPIVGVPKTIDNDLAGTDRTFGYDTACAVVSESVDGLRHTAEAHRRLIVVETMGRTAGWIALGGGLSALADVILIPERPYSRRELVTFVAGRRTEQRGLIIVIAEGAVALPESSVRDGSVVAPEVSASGGVAAGLAAFLEDETGWEARHVVLGHLQRARSPTTFDRFLTTQMGVRAADLVVEGDFGTAVVYRQGVVTHVPLPEIVGPPRLIPANHPWIETATALGIFI